MASEGNDGNMENTVMLGIQKLFNNQQHSDLTIACNGRTWKAHKLITGSQGGYFAAAVNGDFKEGQANHLQLDRDKPAVVEAVIKYLYGLPCEAPTDESALAFYADLYAAGEYYQLPVLKKNALGKFRATIYREKTESDDFANVANKVYNNTPPADRGLRDLVVDYINAHGGLSIELFEEFYPQKELVRDLLKASSATDFELKCVCPDRQRNVLYFAPRFREFARFGHGSWKPVYLYTCPDCAGGSISVGTGRQR